MWRRNPGLTPQTPAPQPPNLTARPSRAHYLLLAVVLLLGFILRVYGLGQHDYWQDEVHGVLRANHIGLVLTEGYLVSNHPPLYPLLLAGWRALGLGYTEASARFLTVLMGLGTLLAAYALGRRVWSPQAGLMAAFLLAVSPVYILHSRELKDYMLLPMTGPLGALALLKAFEKNRWRDWAVYGLAVALMCYSETFAAFLLTGFGVWSLTQFPGRWNRFPGWFAAHAAGLALFLPFIVILLGRTGKMIVSASDWWIPRPAPWLVFLYFKTLATGYTDRFWIFAPAGALLLGLAIVGAWIVLRRHRPSDWLLVMWATVPLGLVVAVSWVVNSIYLYRALLSFGIPVVLLAAIALLQTRRRWVVAAGTVFFGLAAFLPLKDYYAGRYGPHEFPLRPGIHPPIPYNSAAQFILEGWKEGDTVLQTQGCHWMTMNFYGLQGRPHYVAGYSEDICERRAAAEPPPHFTSDPALQLREYFPVPIDELLEGRGRIWLVVGEWERAYLPENPVRVWRRVDARMRQAAHQRFGDLEVFLYVPPTQATPLQRDHDTGLRAQVTYAGELAGTYGWAQPDIALIPSTTPPSQELELRFEDPDASGPTGFAVHNRSPRERTYRLFGRFSDALVPACAMEVPRNDGPEPFCNQRYNPGPPPQHFLQPALAVHFLQPGTTVLRTHLSPLPQGSYRLSLYALGPLGAPEYARALVDLRFLDAAFEPLPPLNPRPGHGWGFFPQGRLRIEEEKARAMEAVLRHNPGCSESYADIGFVRLRSEAAGPAEDLDVPWRTVQPGEVHSFSMSPSVPARRVDVWLEEQREGVNARHIYKLLTGGGSGSLSGKSGVSVTG